MRKRKTIVWFSMIFILYLTVIFGGAKQDRLIRKVTNRSLKDIYKIKTYYRPLQRYVPGEIIVKFNPTLSDFDVAYLIGEFQPKKIAGWDSNGAIFEKNANNVYRIKLPENCNVENMIQVFERNPYVEYAEPNGTGYIGIPEMPYESGKYFPNKLHPIKRKRIKEVQAESLHKDVEKTSRAGNSRRSNEALKKEKKLPKNIHGETKKTQLSDNKSNIRSKAKIHRYRDSEGRIVITNYSLSKSNTKKK